LSPFVEKLIALGQKLMEDIVPASGVAFDIIDDFVDLVKDAKETFASPADQNALDAFIDTTVKKARDTANSLRG
jgi:geranylgeranyl pyrophosphate synthase